MRVLALALVLLVTSFFIACGDSAPPGVDFEVSENNQPDESNPPGENNPPIENNSLCANHCSYVCAQAFATCNTTCTLQPECMADDTSCGFAGYSPQCPNVFERKDIGPPYQCCAGNQLCMCQDWEETVQGCHGAQTCTFETLNSGTDVMGCSDCTLSGGNICLDDVCQDGETSCKVVENSYWEACYTGPGGTLGVGACVGGTRTCDGGAFGDCEGEVTPQPEICDGFDTNCDGEVDSGGVCGVCTPGEDELCYPGPAGTEGVGICMAGTRTCEADMTWGPCLGAVTPEAEACNGLDNDCDGELDNGLPGPCYTGPVGTLDVGICRMGMSSCEECIGEVTPEPAEICDNGLDDDCNGLIDLEDFACRPMRGN